MKKILLITFSGLLLFSGLAAQNSGIFTTQNGIVYELFSPGLWKEVGEVGEYREGTVHCGDPTEVVDVTNPVTGAIWMDRNLGATAVTQTPRSDYNNDEDYIAAEENSFGDLYQWGRGADGHQCRDSDTISTLSSSDQPGHGDFIITPGLPNDWRIQKNDDLWQGVNGVNNPCPLGYRLPTEAELNEERLSWLQKPINSTNDADGAFASPLQLPMAGYRIRSGSGMILTEGVLGWYWSSTNTVDSPDSQYLWFGEDDFAGMFGSNRAFGYSVRCIKHQP